MGAVNLVTAPPRSGSSVAAVDSLTGALDRPADRLSDGCDAGEDEVDPGEELLPVVVLGQLRRHLTHERVLRRVELRPPCGDGREEGRSICLGPEEAGTRSVLPRGPAVRQAATVRPDCPRDR